MTIADVDKGLSEEACEKMVGKILASRHMSVLEHVSFSFGVEGVSRNFTHQLVRHRNTAYSQQSLHYTLAGNDLEVAMPSSLTEKQRGIWKAIRESTFKAYHDLIAEGVPKEEARHLLPSGVETKIVMTSNLRQWLHFVQLRSCVVNTKEIIVVAMKVKKLLEAEMPMMRPHLGPTCWTDNTCHEGKKMCEAPWKDTCLVSGMGVETPYLWARPKKVETLEYLGESYDTNRPQACYVCGNQIGHNGLACPKTTVTTNI